MERFPSLLDLRTWVAGPVDESPEAAPRPFRVRRAGAAYLLEPVGPVWVDGRPATEPTPIAHGALIGSGDRWYRFLEREDGSPCEQPDATVFSPGPFAGAPGGQAADVSAIELPEGRPVTLGRDPERVDVVLEHSVVSRAHARLVRRGREATLDDLQSANGTFLDGERARGPARVRAGQRVDIGPFAFTFDGVALAPISRAGGAEVVASGLTRRGRDTGGRAFTLLDDISLAVRPGEFVAILGPSGSGKSTLLKALSGRERPDQGVVLVNGQDLHAHFDAMKQDVAVVHQRDALHEALTLEQALTYAARLRLPPDTDSAERRRRVGAMLGDLGLEEQRATAIGRLSGGQVKRASLALETLHQPGLVFLDEVTSGLDEPTDRELMRLFRRVADQGRTVVCVTHTLANVEESCHLIVFLAPGGRLAFVGTPAQAHEYFGVERLGDVYELLTARTPDSKLGRPLDPEEWGGRFRNSGLWAEHVSGRGAVRRIASTAQMTSGRAARGRPILGDLASFARQFPVLLDRLAALQRAELLAQAMTIAQCLIVAAALFILFRDISTKPEPFARVEATVKLTFLGVISCLWFGVNGAVKEIVKERTLFERERDAGVHPAAYYAAKLTLLGAASALQATLLFGLVDVLCRPPWDRPLVCGLLVAIGVLGTLVGLWISAVAGSEEVAVGLAPIALIPQVILAGVIAPLAGPGLWLARLGVAAYWGCQGLRRAIPDLVASGQAGDGPGLKLIGVVLILQGAAFAAAALARLGTPPTAHASRLCPGLGGRLKALWP